MFFTVGREGWERSYGRGKGRLVLAAVLCFFRVAGVFLPRRCGRRGCWRRRDKSAGDFCRAAAGGNLCSPTWDPQGARAGFSGEDSPGNEAPRLVGRVGNERGAAGRSEAAKNEEKKKERTKEKTREGERRRRRGKGGETVLARFRRYLLCDVILVLSLSERAGVVVI